MIGYARNDWFEEAVHDLETTGRKLSRLRPKPDPITSVEYPPPAPPPADRRPHINLPTRRQPRLEPRPLAVHEDVHVLADRGPRIADAVAHTSPRAVAFVDRLRHGRRRVPGRGLIRIPGADRPVAGRRRPGLAGAEPSAPRPLSVTSAARRPRCPG